MQPALTAALGLLLAFHFAQADLTVAMSRSSVPDLAKQVDKTTTALLQIQPGDLPA